MSTAPTPSRTTPPAGGPGRMELRKFVAPTMSECLAQVKNELGGAAVILSTRTLHERRLLGLVKRESIEITAGRGMRTMPRRPRPAVLQAGGLLNAIGPVGLHNAGRADAPGVSRAAGPCRDLLNTPAAASAAYLGVTQEIGDLKKLVGDLTRHVRAGKSPDVPESTFDCYSAMRQQQVCEEVARDVCLAADKLATDQQRKDAAAMSKLVRGEIEKRLPVGGGIRRTAKGRPQVIALVGPTGVGKTTTIAKLAANLKYQDNQKVGLITIDTYRIAAIDQLRKYAEIIKTPVAVVASAAEIKDAIARMGDFDYVLIDTAGRSPKDAPRLEELKALLDAAAPDEVHLVLSTTCGTESTKLALQRFSGVRADRLIFTKLDEAAEVGMVLNVCGCTRLPLSYVTHGQAVPSDIETASAAKLARLLTEEPAAV